MHSSAMRAMGGTISSKRPGEEPYLRWILEARNVLSASAAGSGTVIMRRHSAKFPRLMPILVAANPHFRCEPARERGRRGRNDRLRSCYRRRGCCGLLQRVAQCVELGRARLGASHCSRNSGIKQQVSIIAVAAERIATVRAECLLVPVDEIQGNRPDRVVCWQVLRNDERTSGRDGALV